MRPATDPLAELNAWAATKVPGLFGLEVTHRGDDGCEGRLTVTEPLIAGTGTLLTGNLAGIAAVKLAAFELAGFFDAEVGAYGTDHPNRNELVPIALERVERLRGERHDPADVWVIGDTPGDLACALATGAIPLDDLGGADVALPDLIRTDEVAALLTA